MGLTFGLGELAVDRTSRRRRVSTETAVGLGLCGIVLAIAYVGPWLAPHSPSQIVGVPYTDAGDAGVFGTDFLGRDVLSRTLAGGRSVVTLAILATLAGYAAGATVGLVAGYAKSRVDNILMRSVDVLLGFPPLLFLLVVATGVGASKAGLVLAVAIIQLPSIARIVRGATLEQVGLPFVEAAVARGESTSAILRREILPNILRPIFADAGLRLTWSLLLIAAVSFLGLGDQPPAANWALMIAENRTGLTFQPWAVVVPALLIAVLTVGVNLVSDGIARTLGVTQDATKR
jgi:peptide/nickel transport system permease protein